MVQKVESFRPSRAQSFHPFVVLFLQIKQPPQGAATVRGRATQGTPTRATTRPQPVRSSPMELVLESLENLILDVPARFSRINGQLLQFHQDVGLLEQECGRWSVNGGGDQGFVIGIQVSVSKSIRTGSKVQDSGDHHGYSPLTIYMEWPS